MNEPKQIKIQYKITPFPEILEKTFDDKAVMDVWVLRETKLGIEVVSKEDII